MTSGFSERAYRVISCQRELFDIPQDVAYFNCSYTAPLLHSAAAAGKAALKSKAEGYGLVIAVDSQGRIVRSLHDPGGGTVAYVTSVEPHGSELYLGTVEGQVAVIFVMVVAAAEVTVGLAIIVALFRKRQTIQVDQHNALRN